MLYFNEYDRYPAQWLRNLFPDSTVDERSVAELQPNEIAHHERVHLFAGIGGWELALQLAGWPAGRQVWTGSCPCQPFSAAGKRQAEKDSRHLWPEMRRLISECHPATVFGEQVASRLGREWLSGVRADLEELGYAVGAADLCAASVGAPHIRQRLFWVAQSDGRDAGAERQQRGGQHGQQPADSGYHARPGHSTQQRPQEQWSQYRSCGERCGGLAGPAVQTGLPQWNGPTISIKCRDGQRRISAEPKSFPVANGIPNRTGRLRAYGNAIVPPLAAVFIRSFLETQ